MAAVRYTWMFRTAAVVYLLFGASGFWRYALTDYDAAHRPVGIALAALALFIGAFLFAPKRFAIVLSALGAGILAIAAALAAPVMHGPVIVACGIFSFVMELYAVFAARELLSRDSGEPPTG